MLDESEKINELRTFIINLLFLKVIDKDYLENIVKECILLDEKNKNKEIYNKIFKNKYEK